MLEVDGVQICEDCWLSALDKQAPALLRMRGTVKTKRMKGLVLWSKNQSGGLYELLS